MCEPMLQLNNITKRFGNLTAVREATMQIRTGEIVGLIGPNGAGKTTLFNVITGLLDPDGGRVIFKGTDITGHSPHQNCKDGMGRTFQVTRAFRAMTVAESIRVGAYNRRKGSDVDRKVDEVISLFELDGIRQQECRDLTPADLKRLELARTVATEPDLLLLDETGAGLTSAELADLMRLLLLLNHDMGITLCVVEHVMQLVMGICTRILVLDAGELIAQGTPNEISSNQRVIAAYLGERGAR